MDLVTLLGQLGIAGVFSSVFAYLWRIERADRIQAYNAVQKMREEVKELQDLRIADIAVLQQQRVDGATRFAEALREEVQADRSALDRSSNGLKDVVESVETVIARLDRVERRLDMLPTGGRRGGGE